MRGHLDIVEFFIRKTPRGTLENLESEKAAAERNKQVKEAEHKTQMI